MKKLFLFAAAGLFFAATGNAQTNRNVPQTQKVQSDSSRHFQKGKMMADLNLTTDQKSQLKQLRNQSKEQRDAIKNDASLTPDQRNEMMKELRKSQSEKMNSILTPDQQAKRKAFMQERKQNHKMDGKMHKKAHRGRSASDSSIQ